MASAQIRGIQKYFGVTVGPGKANGAASSFFRGIIREPLVSTQVCQHVRYERDDRIAANRVGGATADRALTLGVTPDASFKAIIEQYIDDCQQASYPANALRGPNR